MNAIRRHLGKMLTALAVVLLLFLTYRENWSVDGVACKARGGRLYNDGCYKMVLVKLD